MSQVRGFDNALSEADARSSKLHSTGPYWLIRLGWKRVLGGILSTTGVGLTVCLAWVGATSPTVSGAWQAFLALAGIVAQIGAAALFSSVGKADPGLATRAIQRLQRSGQQAAAITRDAEDLYESSTEGSPLRADLGRLSTALGYNAEGFVEAIKDWQTFQPDVVHKVLEEGETHG